MAKKKGMKALVMGAVAMTMSASMLVGTTFAWFTDSVTSSNNVIKSGNLDVELEYWDGDSWEDVKGQSNILTNQLWEPGATEVAYFRLANAGSLDFKYQFGVNIVSETTGKNVAGETLRLSDYIYFGMDSTDAVEISDNSDKAAIMYETREDALLSVGNDGQKISKGYNEADKLFAGTEKYLAMVVYMPETVDNKANHDGVNVPQIDLGINVFATQLASENDSFGPDYDTGAPIMTAPEEAPDNGDDLILRSSMESNVTFIVPASVYNEFDSEVTSVSIAASAPIVDATNNTVTFETLELIDQDGNEVDLSDALGKITVTLPVGSAFAEGTKVEVSHDGEFVTYATVTGGVISYEVSHFCEVSITTAEEVSFEETENKEIMITSVQEFVTFAESVNGGNSYAGKTVKLGANIDLAGVTWMPIGNSSTSFNGTFDGNGFVISNLDVRMAGKSNVGLFGVTKNGEIKNVTIDNAKVVGRLNVGVVAGTPYTSKYTNINVTGNVEVDGMAYVGTVGGKNAYANWTDVTVNVNEGSYVSANSVENGTAYRTYVGGVVGFNGEGGHEFKDITSNIDVYGSTCDVGGAFGIAHYNNKFTNVTVSGDVEIYGAEEAEEADEMGGVVGVWHNQSGTSVTLTNCKFTGKLSANVAVDLTGNEIAGAAYGTTGTGILVIDGVEYVGSASALQTKLNNATGNATVNLAGPINGDVTVAQKPDVQITIAGNGNTVAGVITVDGKSGTYTTAGLTIVGVNFNAQSISQDACINLGDGTNATRYTCNVTVENCTFDVAGAVGIKSYTGGDKNLTVKGCTATANAHSLMQVKGIDGVLVEKCTVNSKNGANFNNSTNVTVDDCKFNVKGYALRFGESSGGSGAKEVYEVKNNTLKSECNDGDAVIILRGTADYSTLTMTNNKIEGTLEIKNTATGAKIVIDGVTAVSNGDSLKVALKANEDVIFINDITMTATKGGYSKAGIEVTKGHVVDGNGYTLTVNGANDTWDCAISATGGTIKNLTVAGAMRGIFMPGANADVYIENVEFKNVVYTFNSDAGNSAYGVYLTDCKVNGWTSFSAVHKEVIFTNCSFGEGSGYKFCRPYNDAKFVNCEFVAGYQIDARGAVTLENCKLDGVVVTADNLATLVANVDKVTLN
ncbi:MAG: hypothetical protein IJB34_02145 [Clostridia bacterium]|nr:hypothetical protein [Clostridia bacterium]